VHTVIENDCSGGLTLGMPRRHWIISFLLIWVLLLSGASAVGAVKAGSKCSKVGATSVVANKKFTCIKSGKKLVWNKGVVIKPVAKPSPIPVATLDPIPTPTPAVTPTSTPTPSPSPTSTESRSSEDIKNLAILEKSWAQVSGLPVAQDSGRIVFLIDPKFPSQSRDAIKRGIDLTIGKFEYLIKVKKPIYAIFSTSLEFELAQFKKYDLMQQTYEAEARSNPILLEWRKDHYKQIDSGFKKFASGGTMPLYNGVQEPAGYYMYFRLHPENQDSTTVLLGAHETGHLMQWQMNWDFPETVPSWWIEGQAQMIGESVASQANTFADFEKFIKAQTTPDFGGGFFSGTTNLRELEGDAVTRSQFSCTLCGTRLVYSRGKVAIHYLSSKFGNEKVMTFMGTLSRGNRWWQSFEKTFGISVDTFYAEYDSYAKWFGDYFSPGWQSSRF